MKDSDRYTKVVVWSEEDDCYVGMAPGLTYGGCHGDDQQAVFRELCDIVDEIVASIQARGETLPPATASTNITAFVTDKAA